MEKLFLWITNGRYRRAVEAVREDIKATGNMPDGAAVGSEGTDGDIRVMAGGLPVVTVPTGLAVLTLMTTGGQAQLEQLRERVNLMPQTVLSFVCADGLSLQVLMAYVLPDGSLPVGDERAAALFQQYACRRAVDFVWAATGVMGMARATFQLSWDARAYRNTHVQPVVMEQPTAPLSDKTAAPLPTAPELDRDVLPGYTSGDGHRQVQRCVPPSGLWPSPPRRRTPGGLGRSLSSGGHRPRGGHEVCPAPG